MTRTILLTAALALTACAQVENLNPLAQPEPVPITNADLIEPGKGEAVVSAVGERWQNRPPSDPVPEDICKVYGDAISPECDDNEPPEAEPRPEPPPPQCEYRCHPPRPPMPPMMGPGAD